MSSSTKVLLLLLLFSILAGMIPVEQNYSHLLQEQNTPYAVMLTENSTIYTDTPFNLTLVINNPTNYLLENVTFSIELPNDFELIDNESNKETEINVTPTEEETINITGLVKVIDKNSIYFLNLILKCRVTGDFTMRMGSVKAVKVKGEYTQNITISEGLEIGVKIVKKTLPSYPPEGKTDPSVIILIVSVLAPVLVMFFARRIAWHA